jgi:hypothetical protein
VPYDIAIFAGAGLRFVGVDHEIMGRSPARLGMNDHLSTGRPAPPRPPSPVIMGEAIYKVNEANVQTCPVEGQSAEVCVDQSPLWRDQVRA